MGSTFKVASIFLQLEPTFKVDLNQDIHRRESYYGKTSNKKPHTFTKNGQI
jgi:hypothetical protein